MRSLVGDHNRPLHQNVVDLPPEISRAARAGIKEGSGVLKRVSTMARDAGAPEEVSTSTPFLVGRGVCGSEPLV